MSLFDTHIHLFDERFGDISTSEINRKIISARQNNINYFCNVGLNLNTSQLALKIAKKIDNCYSACGFHPTLVNEWNENSEQALLDLLSNEKVIAIGEIGLDYFHNYTDPTQQKEVLKKQLKLAETIKKPVLLHIREGYDDALKIIKQFKVTGIVHCFSGTIENANDFIALGFMISFSGVITFQNAKKLQNIAQQLPLNKIVLETDAPYLAPIPFRGKINQPKYLIYTAKKIADLKMVSLKEVIDQTTKNAKQILNLH